MHHRCPIYLDSMVKPQTIKCGHVFCQDCLSQALRILNVCPICKEPQGVVTGNQPPGQITRSTLHSSLPVTLVCCISPLNSNKLALW